MRIKGLMVIVFLTAGLVGCGWGRKDSDRSDRQSVAFKAGEVAHELSKEAGKAAKAAGREIGKDAHEAREGWSQAQRDERDRKQKKREQ